MSGMVKKSMFTRVVQNIRAGEWMNDKENGKGIIDFSDGRYWGFKNGMCHGDGVI